jgi:hypothetical protein
MQFFFNPIWYLVRNWIGFSSVDPFSMLDHFVQFSHLVGSFRMRCSIMQIIWISCIWVIWKEMNDKNFRNQEVCNHQLLDKIKMLSFLWLKAKYPHIGFGYHDWCFLGVEIG